MFNAFLDSTLGCVDVDLVLFSIPKANIIEIIDRASLISQLGHRGLSSRTGVNHTTKPLKTEGTLKTQPTEGRLELVARLNLINCLLKQTKCQYSQQYLNMISISYIVF